MNGLLDDPRQAGLLSLGLRLMSTPGKFGTALGQAGMGAMGDMQQAAAAQDAKKTRALQEQMMQMKLAEAQREQAEALAKQQRDAAIQGAYRNAFESPQMQALAAGGGPTAENAAKLPGLAPRLNQQKLIEGLLPVDPVSAYKLAQPKDKKLSKIETMLVAGKPVNVMFYEDGTSQVLPFGVKPDIQLLGLGDKTQAVDKARLTGGESWKEGLSPAGAVAAQANNIAAESNALHRQLMNRDLQLRVEEREAKAIDRGQQKSTATATMADSIAALDRAISHPGRETATGLSGQIDPRNYVASTDAKNFQVLVEQIGGKAFLQAFESLKGGGQITQIEGQKATDAIARLNRAQSDEAYLEALNDFRGVLADAYRRHTGKEYVGQQMDMRQLGTPPDISDIMNRYRK